MKRHASSWNKAEVENELAVGPPTPCRITDSPLPFLRSDQTTALSATVMSLNCGSDYLDEDEELATNVATLGIAAGSYPFSLVHRKQHKILSKLHEPDTLQQTLKPEDRTYDGTLSYIQKVGTWSPSAKDPADRVCQQLGVLSGAVKRGERLVPLSSLQHDTNEETLSTMPSIPEGTEDDIDFKAPIGTISTRPSASTSIERSKGSSRTGNSRYPTRVGDHATVAPLPSLASIHTLINGLEHAKSFGFPGFPTVKGRDSAFGETITALKEWNQNGDDDRKRRCRLLPRLASHFFQDLAEMSQHYTCELETQNTGEDRQDFTTNFFPEHKTKDTVSVRNSALEVSAYFRSLGPFESEGFDGASMTAN